MTLTGIKNIIEGKFKESAIVVDYYEPEFEWVMRSPIIVISSLPLDSIIVEHDVPNENYYPIIKNLKSFIFNK
jgi:hypothetical protein